MSPGAGTSNDELMTFFAGLSSIASRNRVGTMPGEYEKNPCLLPLLQQRQARRSLLSLPHELLLEIAELLPCPRDICSLMRVNRQLHAYLREVPLRQNIKHHDSSLLPWAVRHNRVELVIRLIKLKADLNTTCLWGGFHAMSTAGMPFWKSKTPLQIAVEKDNLRLIKILWKAQKSTSIVLDGTTLALALERRNEAIARILLNDVRQVDFDVAATGKTLLHLACDKRLVETTRCLLERGADPNWKRRFKYAQDLLHIKDPHTQRLDADGLQILRMLFLYQLDPDEDLQRIGAEHTDPRVRYLFGLKTHTSKIAEAIKASQAEYQYNASFPPLAHSPLMTGSREVSGTDVWTIQDTQHLRKCLSRPQKEESKPSRSTGKECMKVYSDPFPRLGSGQQTQGSHAHQRWSDFQKREQSRCQKAEASQSKESAASECSINSPDVDPDPFPPLVAKAGKLSVQVKHQWAHIQNESQITRNTTKALETVPLKGLPPKATGFPPLSSLMPHAKNASDIFTDFRRRDAGSSYSDNRMDTANTISPKSKSVKAQNESARRKNQL